MSDIEQLTQLILRQAELSAQRDERLSQIMEQLVTARLPPAGTAATDAPPAAVTPSPATPRLPASATPAPHLTSSASLREFAVWREKLDGYMLLTGASALPVASQRAALLSLLDEDWHRVLRYGLSVADDTPLADVVDAMEAHLRKQRSVLIDRRAFYARVQEEGEDFEDYLCAIKELAAFCDFCEKCFDSRLRDKVVCGLRDEDTVKRLLEDPDLDLKKTVDVCRAAENARTTCANIRAPSPAAALSRVSSRGARAPPRGGRPDRPGSAARCRRCGRDAHGNPADCRAKSAICDSCGRQGHFAAVCESAGRDDSAANPAEGRRGTNRGRPARRRHRSAGPQRSVQRLIEDVIVNGLTTRPAPNVDIRLSHSAGDATVRARADSGAEATVIGLKKAEAAGIDPAKLQPSTTQTFSGVGGRPLTCLGSFEATLRLGSRCTAAIVFVLEETTDMLLSWFHCVALGILPENFPAQIQSTTVAPPAPRRAKSTPPEGGAERAAPSGRSCQTDSAAPAETSGGEPGKLPAGRAEKMARVELPSWTSDADPPEEVRAAHAAAIIAQYPRVFGSDTTLREMAGGPLVIELQADACPSALTAARPVPYGWRDEIKDQLDDLQAKGIIEPVDYPTDWCHPMVPVSKRPSGVRLCVDFSRLNKYVKRPTYPVRTPQDAVASVAPGSRWLTTLDAKMGYFQVPIDEKSRDLTCFITPWGRYRFRRAAMGLVSSSDVYLQRGDQALGDIPNTCKVVDDLLLYDKTYREHLAHVIAIVRRCDEWGITLNADKFRFAQQEVKYCGYKITPNGYTSDGEKIKAIADFPRPENITDLRSFMGLANQLGGLSSELAHAAQPLRDLLKTRHLWCWTTQHEVAFLRVKTVLSAPPVMAYFDPSLPTMLQTDAARTKGLGFALLQRHGESWKLVHCGSRFISDVESRYAVVELEMAACVWAVKKCRIYLAGLPRFDLVVDHRPLVPILNSKLLSEIENPRLQRMREKLSGYIFTASWQRGRDHSVPDALSRSPVSSPAANEDEAADESGSDPLKTAVLAALRLQCESDGDVQLAPVIDPGLERIRAAAERDADYRRLRDAILSGFAEHRHEMDPEIRPFWGVRHQLAIDDDMIVYGARLVIPTDLRRSVLERLHDSHQGVERTKRRARLSVYWPGIDRDITNIVSACAQCRQRAASHAREPMWQEDCEPSRVFEVVSTDYFHAGGRTYLVYVDRLSGWPYVTVCPRTASADHLTRELRMLFSQTGVPSVLRSDGGPQFASGTLRRFLQRWEVRHEMSSPHYPQANGQAEATVKSVKKLILAASSNGRLDQDQLDRGLLELRNTPRADGRSPAQVVFGHPLRSGVPTHHRAFAPEWQKAADACDAKAAEEKEKTVQRYDSSARPLSQLQIGNRVDLQDPATGRWDRVGTVVGIGQRRTYLVKTASGRVLWRNRRYLRPYRPLLTVPAPGAAAPPPSASEQRPPAAAAEPDPAPAPRRSNRARRSPKRLRVRWGANSYA